MATFNTSHHDVSGGVVLFSGELILLYIDDVKVSVENHAKSQNGRLFLTTHRMIFIAKPLTGQFKSFSAPFYAMKNLKLEQPVFGANYIKGMVAEEGKPDSPPLTFNLTFKSGGAIEFGQAMDLAAKQAQRMASQAHFSAPPPYQPYQDTFYQAPPNVYQPAYNCGFVLPTNTFPAPPPAGFIYAMEVPPPYPGINTQPQAYPQATAYPYQAFPAYGYPYQPPSYTQEQNGAAAAGATSNGQPSAPPTYSEATKKTQ